MKIDSGLESKPDAIAEQVHSRRKKARFMPPLRLSYSLMQRRYCTARTAVDSKHEETPAGW
jgi:hypothetical protein